MTQLEQILKLSLELGASDIHIVAGLKPLFRIHKELGPVEEFDVLSPQDTENFARQLVSEERYEEFLVDRDLDFSAALPGMGRFRVNAHFQRETVGMAFRAISSNVPALEDLNLPAVAQSLASCPRGLVLVTGPAGSGKSTALASMIDAMNELYAHHIITLEDPIEYEIKSKKCVVEQREVGADVTTFASGLRHALRQDPDIILVGEMRDLETTAAAISAAETGHLVLSTLHTQSASQTIERIIDIYPPAQQAQIQSMLST
ncbi:MAG: PilT/PilU family type 4a pilus ATPase, partial [Phycisphaerae bacterium]|nr:PilT/PilU family type 4a pilus ATPase [Phycisphaerae bacterium]